TAPARGHHAAGGWRGSSARLRPTNVLLSTAGFLLAALATRADEAYRLTTVLYGASYYHEYMPYERLEKDARLMEDAGVTVVRVGESTWSSWEPRDGEFEFAWMEKIIERMHRARIKVILGTPTYPTPPWPALHT